MLAEQTWERDEYTISTARARLDLAVIHDFLAHSYWATGISRAVVEQAIAYSLPFGVYHGSQQVGFARVISDYTTFAYLSDVFILEAYRGRGLSLWLLEVVTEHPALQGLRRWLLLTRDAHGLYAKVGFTPSKLTERFMEIHLPDIYRR